MTRIGAFLLAILAGGVLVFQVDYRNPADPSTACTRQSATAKINTAFAVVGGVFHAAGDPKDETVNHSTTKELVDGGMSIWTNAIKSFSSAYEGGTTAGKATAAELAAPPITCETTLTNCYAATQGVGAGGVLTGADLAADALRRAGFPDKEIPTFVAIAELESGFRVDPKPSPVVDGYAMHGMWQMNSRYWKDADWRNPYTNAIMAKRARDESITINHGNPYYPWSTWRAAVANAKRYARFASVSTSPPQTSPVPHDSVSGAILSQDPACDPETGMGPASVGSWNTWGRVGNSASSINRGAGFASIVGLQEIRHNNQLHVPGYGVTVGKMAVPIIYRLADVELVKTNAYPNGWKRETVLTGYARDKSAVSAIFRNKKTGKVFAVINTHMLVQGGTGWAKQAVRVKAIKDRLVAAGYPVILIGDMNAPNSKVASVFGGNRLGHHIDYVIGYGIKLGGDRVLSKAGSDHARVMVDFPSAPVSQATTQAPGATTRTVVDQGVTYQIPIPAGPAGVAINYALDQLDKPYVWAAHGPNAYDCSGLVSAAWKKAGESVFPQTEVMSRLEPRATGPDQPGDLWGHFGHVQMYLGKIDGKDTVVEAANPKDGIQIDQSGWMHVKWKLRPTG